MGRERSHRFGQSIAQILSSAVTRQVHEDDEASGPSTSVAVTDRPPFPMNRCPSQCPGTNPSFASAGLSRIMTMSGKRLVRCSFQTTRPATCPSAAQGSCRNHG